MRYVWAEDLEITWACGFWRYTFPPFSEKICKFFNIRMLEEKQVWKQLPLQWLAGQLVLCFKPISFSQFSEPSRNFSRIPWFTEPSLIVYQLPWNRGSWQLTIKNWQRWQLTLSISCRDVPTAKDNYPRQWMRRSPNICRVNQKTQLWQIVPQVNLSSTRNGQILLDYSVGHHLSSFILFTPKRFNLIFKIIAS